MQKVKFGIIGCGGIAARFARALAKSETAELVAVAARDLSRAEAFAREHGAARFYGDYQSLVEDPSVQAVYIATVHTTHAENAQRALRAGKAVISEKPFFVGGKEAEETIALAREKKVLMMEGFWTRTMPAYLKAKEWIKAGRIGELSMIRAAFCFNMPTEGRFKDSRIWNPAVGGGALLDAGVYPYEYVTGILDAKPVEMKTLVQRTETGVDGTVTMSMKFASGVIADCLTSVKGYMDDVAILSGSKGYIKQYYFLGCRKTELYEGRELTEVYEDPEEEGFVHEIDHFASLYWAGKTESDLIPLDDTLDFARRAEAILSGNGDSSTEICSRSKDTLPTGSQTDKAASAPSVPPLPSKFSAEELAAQEETYRFEHFSVGDAMKLAGIMNELAAADGKSAAIQIELNGFEVYRFMPEGTGMYNDLWMQKKKNTVKLMGKSTLRLWTDMALRGFPRPMSIEPGNIVFCGGGFPILLADGTLIGVIAVSGPGDEYEHELIIRALEELNKG